MNGNRYFQVLEPFRLYRKVGSSLSNTWIGRSQAINSVYEVVNAKPGDRLHALVGGLFIESEGQGWSAKLEAPKHIFEKNYGGNTEMRDLEGMCKDVRIYEIDKPEGDFPYVAWRDDKQKDFGPHHHELIVLEASPELQEFRRGPKVDISSIGGLQGQQAKLTDFDHFSRPVVGTKLDFGDGTGLSIEWAFKPDFYTVDLIGKIPMPHLESLTVPKRLSRQELIDTIISLEDAETYTPTP